MKNVEKTVLKPTVKDYNDRVEELKGLKAQADEVIEKSKAQEKLLEEQKILLKKYEDANLAGLSVRHEGSSGNSDEMKTLRYFGVPSVKDLLMVNTCHDEFRAVPDDIKFLANRVKHEIFTARVIAQLFHGAPYDKIGGTKDQEHIAHIPNILDTYYGKNVLAPRLKAFGSAVSGGGAEWIPTAIASTYISEVELGKEIVGSVQDVTMPTSPYELPTSGGYTRARRIAENTTLTDSSFTTGNLTFTAGKFGEYYVLPTELTEDSAPNILALGRSELTQAHLRAFEVAMVNGTKIGTTHIDSDTQAGAADLAEKQYHGLRYYALANTANGGTTDFGNAVVTDANLQLMRQRMGILGVHPGELLWVPGATSYLQMLATSNVVTVDKMGPRATVLTGQLGSYQGTPIITTGFMRQDMNATGVYDGVTTDRTGILLVRRNRWYFGTRRPIRLALRECRSADDRYEIASYSRVDFTGHTQSASEVGISYGYNVSI